MLNKSLTWTHALLFAVVAIVAFASQAQAQDRLGDSREQDRALRARSSGEVRPLDKVIAGERTKGKVLDVELKDRRYRVKVLDADGRVRTVDVDATTDRSGSGGGSDRSGNSERSGSSDHSGGGSGRSGSSGRDGNEGSGGRGRGGGR